MRSFAGIRIWKVSLAMAMLAIATSSRAVESQKRFILDRVTHQESARWTALTRAIPSTSGVRVFWWNIANGASEADAKSLTSNLELLAVSKIAPDVIALGEYSARALPETTYSQLAKRYPVRKFIRYNSLTSTGIAIFSKLPLTTSRVSELEWVPASLDGRGEAEYRAYWANDQADGGEGFYARPLREILFAAGKKTVSFTPLHLAEPWRDLSKRTDGKIEFALATASELFFGTSNPLITQVDSLVRWLKAGKNADKLLVGDFNLPRGFAGVPTLGFRRLERVLNSAILHTQNSFPTPSSPHTFPSMQIDHAFVGGALAAPVAGVLPLKGSDHFPIFLIVR